MLMHNSDAGKPKPKPVTELPGRPALRQEPDPKRRAKLIRTVKRGLGMWREVCLALDELRSNDCYSAPYSGFEELCLKEFGFRNSTCHQYANVGRVLRLLAQSTAVDRQPESIRQVRPLLDIKDDTKVVEVWIKAITLGGTGGLSERIVRKARDIVIGPPVSSLPPAEERVKKVERTIRSDWERSTAAERRFIVERLKSLAGGLSEELEGAKTARPEQQTLDVQTESNDSLIGDQGVKKRVLGFRVSQGELDALERYVAQHQMPGVRSSGEFARKLLLDFVGGRLVYTKTEYQQ
jgi:hypothetical protein